MNYALPLSSVDVQRQINSFIEKKCEPIDAAIKNQKKQIVLLQERKQILINEVVTGKVKVL